MVWSSGVTDYCNQVCGGGNCGTGPLCMYGINAETHMPPRNLRDGGIWCMSCQRRRTSQLLRRGKRPTNLLVRHFITEAELTAYKAGLDCIENEFDEIDGLNVVGSKVSFTRGTKERRTMRTCPSWCFLPLLRRKLSIKESVTLEGMHAP